MRHGVDFRKAHAKVGDVVPVYPPPWLGEPFIGTVERVRKNKWGRISYIVNGKSVFAEDLWPSKDQTKLRMRCKC